MMQHSVMENKRVGERFTFLTVVDADYKIVIYPSGNRSKYVLVRCDCGTEKFVQLSSLVSGDTISCGCSLGLVHKRESCSRSNTKHGGAGTRTYSIWKGMRKRCNNKNESSYPRYGGRGIHVCERWSSFETFLADMGECPAGYSIERIDVNGNYEPSNCKWIPKNEQSLNRTYNKIVQVNGENMLFSHALASMGVAKSAGGNYRSAHGITHQEAIDRYAARSSK